MKILATGGRFWNDVETVRHVFRSFGLFPAVDASCTRGTTRLMGPSEPIEPIVHHLIVGDAKGLDTIAADVARSLGWTVEIHEALWKTYGLQAGPIRNGKMLLKKPDRVVAFHDNLWQSVGTWHMVQIARRVGVPTQLYWPPHNPEKSVLGMVCDICWHPTSHEFCRGKVTQEYIDRVDQEWLQKKKIRLNDPCMWLACEPIAPNGDWEHDAMLAGDNEGYCCDCAFQYKAGRYAPTKTPYE
jgi:hypothetical protein